jgi:uncharacterized membrane protein YkvA (DUF1232 family)
MSGWIRRWRNHWVTRLRGLKRESLVVYYAARDPRLPWHVRLLALAIAAYALSPIDLIPDFIPVLGYLDDLVLIPLGVALVVKLTPADILADARDRAALAAQRPASRIAAAVIVVLWLLASWLAWRGWRHWHAAPLHR